MVKYIDGKPANGILYDWKKIEKEYNALGVPPQFYRPPFSAIPYNKYFGALSDRSTGKTTGWILLGMVMNKLYGTQIQYVRTTADELTPSFADELVGAIKDYNGGEYILKLTDGVYNSIYYHWKQFYYCCVDEKGNRVAVAPESFIQCLSIDRHGDYKSSYNAPKGDLIILDEFIGKYYRPNEAIDFFDLTKTIIRERQSPIIAMLANTIKLSSQYFEEFEISREVVNMKKGERRQFITAKGTHILLEIVDAEVTRSKERKEVNRLFYGFKNPKLGAITGETLFAFDSVPHTPPHDDSWYAIENRIFIETGLDLIKCVYCYSDDLGYHFEIHRATRTYDDSVILTLEAPTDARQLWGFGTPRMCKVWGRMLADRKIFFSSNEVGTIFNDYLQRYRVLKTRT